MKEAEQYIKATTGFSPQDLLRKRGELRDEFRGKMEAPFGVELY